MNFTFIKQPIRPSLVIRKAIRILVLTVLMYVITFAMKVISIKFSISEDEAGLAMICILPFVLGGLFFGGLVFIGIITVIPIMIYEKITGKVIIAA